jgi:hypothetical protein
VTHDAAEARQAVNIMAGEMRQAMALATPEERYAALDGLWRASSLIARRAMSELMMAFCAGYRP